MSILNVDTIQNAAGTGRPDFANGLNTDSINSGAVSGLNGIAVGGASGESEITLTNNASQRGFSLRYETASGIASMSTNGADPATVPAFTITASGNIRFDNYGAGTLVTDASGNITASSDAALKENVFDFSKGLAAVAGLRPVSWNWKAETGLDTVQAYYGFIAQEAEIHIPESVYGVDGSKTMSDKAIIGALVNAVKELKTRVETLEGA